MNEYYDEEMKEFRGRIADDLGHEEKGQTPWLGGSRNLSREKKVLILGGSGILILIVLIALLSGGGREVSRKDLSNILARLDGFEETLTRLEGVEGRVQALERREGKLQQSLVEADRPGGDLSQRLDELSQRFDRLQRTMGSIATKARGIPSIQRKPLSLGKRRYYKVRPGDTLCQIAEKYGISLDELCRLNDISPEKIIRPGQKLVVAPSTSR
jgi:hypothetical protein